MRIELKMYFGALLILGRCGHCRGEEYEQLGEGERK